MRSGAIAGSWNTGARPRRWASLGRRSVDRLAVDADRPGVGAQHAGEDLDERRLAGAVGAEQGVDLAGRDREVDGAQGDDRAERLGDGGGLQQWSGHRQSTIRVRQPDDPS